MNKKWKHGPFGWMVQPSLHPQFIMGLYRSIFLYYYFYYSPSGEQQIFPFHGPSKLFIKFNY